MKLGVVLPATRTLAAAQLAEDIGVDSVWVRDHFSNGGLEAMTTVAAVAVGTERVEVGAYMLNASLRDPAVLTKTIDSLEQLAPGRIRVLLGTGWDRSDYEALGVDFPSPDARSRRTAEVLEVLKRNTSARVEVAGVRDDVLRLAACEADGWALSADALDAYFERVGALRRACEEVGRDVGELRISCTLPDLDSAPQRMADLAAQGVDEFRIVLDGDIDRSMLQKLVREVKSPKEAYVSERMVKVGGLELWTESFGDVADETILLITGPATGLAWPDELCEAFVEGGRHVIRYDHRDTGRSTTIDYSADPYTLSDLAADAIGVLDAYGVERAHLVGLSGGGMVAQTLAVEHPDRVASLTSWGSTPVAFGADDTLPGPDPKVVEAMVTSGQATTDEERIDGFTAVWRAFAGSLEPFDEARTRALAGRMVAHTENHTAFMNHWMAFAASGDRRDRLAEVTAPTLVIHGTEDPIVLLAHGEATAEAIPGARLLTIEGLGHDIPLVAIPQIADAILEHTASVEAKR